MLNGLRRAVVHENRAGSADAVLAANVRASETEILAKEINKQFARLGGTLALAPVDRHRYRVSLWHPRHHLLSCCSNRFAAP